MAATTLTDVQSRDVEEARFRVMGTDAHLIVVGGPTLLERARARLDDLEARWSRFREDSELSRLNRANGAPVVVSTNTFELLTHACSSWRATAGAFDPTVLPALESAGYDRDFATLDPAAGSTTVSSSAAPGCNDVELDPLVRSVRLPIDVRIDLGGIGKGFAADLVTEELLDAGARGACVNLGGDLRVDGAPPSGDTWPVAIEAEMPRGARLPVLRLRAGAVATTSRARRTWRRGGVVVHHIIDPLTGSPARTPWVSATVLAGRTVDAEPFAKAAFLAPTVDAADSCLRVHGLAGLLVDADGGSHQLGDFAAFV